MRASIVESNNNERLHVPAARRVKSRAPCPVSSQRQPCPGRMVRCHRRGGRRRGPLLGTVASRTLPRAKSWHARELIPLEICDPSTLKRTRCGQAGRVRRGHMDQPQLKRLFHRLAELWRDQADQLLRITIAFADPLIPQDVYGRRTNRSCETPDLTEL